MAYLSNTSNHMKRQQIWLIREFPQTIGRSSDAVLPKCGKKSWLRLENILSKTYRCFTKNAQLLIKSDADLFSITKHKNKTTTNFKCPFFLSKWQFRMVNPWLGSQVKNYKGVKIYTGYVCYREYSVVLIARNL